MPRITKFFTQYFKHTNNVPLGRWHLNTCDFKKEIKIMMANHDSCGASECDSPYKLKENIDKIKNK